MRIVSIRVSGNWGFLTISTSHLFSPNQLPIFFIFEQTRMKQLIFTDMGSLLTTKSHKNMLKGHPSQTKARWISHPETKRHGGSLLHPESILLDPLMNSEIDFLFLSLLRRNWISLCLSNRVSFNLSVLEISIFFLFLRTLINRYGEREVMFGRI